MLFLNVEIVYLSAFDCAWEWDMTITYICHRLYLVIEISFLNNMEGMVFVGIQNLQQFSFSLYSLYKLLPTTWFLYSTISGRPHIRWYSWVFARWFNLCLDLALVEFLKNLFLSAPSFLTMHCNPSIRSTEAIFESRTFFSLWYFITLYF